MLNFCLQRSTLQLLKLLNLDQYNKVKFIGWTDVSNTAVLVFEMLEMSLEKYYVEGFPFNLRIIRSIVQKGTVCIQSNRKQSPEPCQFESILTSLNCIFCFVHAGGIST